ncbi:D-alanyl-D-alanine carboxypeptidase PBP3 [Streptococcus pseudoporcinus]|uniref:serine-type D-Ala-D-Ala carboxypeptidase n=1 Tax=Streptococcus pseudoporcinus LQ 940-04 TaxID=875093 RepID=G5K923_9STRE|nr:D-alanyl-D-alanine carboxypeptidase PBP3 [Streptococcus pseudoporcinus]EFR44428.1 serine-type D-Ala-D-Ala carboxypeptidase [Streptococcus pseudoporcinus SPIN 20026]EHI64371.1 beta-lactamase-like protein [Streptococcus pseudoporcinus LQ 940-04]VEF93498.1 D-alanyl-D-alanine carboxypeptidase [Streptococcus pseudoporcinus]
MKKLVFLILPLLFCFLPKTILADDYKLPAKSGIAFEVSTGKILYEKNAKKTLPIASLSKILTTYLVYKEVQSGNLSWDTPVKISNYPYELTTNYSISNVPLDARQYTVEELLTAMLVTNANSPAIALAEKIAGTEPLFVDKMKKQLQEWKIHKADLVNASGLSNEQLGNHIYPNSQKDAENKMSALDLAIVTRHLLLDYPQVLELTKKPAATFRGDQIFSYNFLLEGMPNHRKGANGLFVAFSENNGASLITSSTENKMSVVSIIINTEKSKDDKLAHFTTANTLLDNIAQKYEPVTLLEKGQHLKNKDFPVTDSPMKHISLISDKTLTIIQKRGTTTTTDLVIRPLQKEFRAPIKQNQKLATASYKDSDRIGIGYLGDSPQVSLSAQQRAPRSFFLKVWWNHLVTYVNENL